MVSLTCLVTGMGLPAASLGAANPIQLENAQPGTTAWQLKGGTSSPSPNIRGYASEMSLQPGDVLHMHVSTSPAAPYRIEIYRLGWYGGTGGRLIACTPSCSTSKGGTTQPIPTPDPNTGYLDAGWPVTDTTTVGNWTSGYYVAKLVVTSGAKAGQGSWIPFIVRSSPGTHSTILVQASVNTWQAYNNWGGKSLYTFNSTHTVVPASGTNAAAMVSFNRPFGNDPNNGPMAWEYGLVRFLERSGYDVSYQADVDTDSNPSSLLGHRLDVVNGHDEYWSPTMRNGYEAARAAKVNLAFIGGNIGYWQARYQDSSRRTLIEYRSTKLDPEPDPRLKTVPFSKLSPPRPECQLLGVGYPGGLANVTTDPPRSYAIAPAAISDRWFVGTGFLAGNTIFDSVGYEWDNVQPGCAVPRLHVLLHFSGLQGVQGSAATADAVTYTASSGARVFSDGSLQLTWALDDFGHTPHVNANAQRLFANIFSDLGAAPPAVSPGAIAISPRSPRPGATLWSPRPRLRWSAQASGAFALAHYEVLVDGNRAGSSTLTSYTLAGDLADGKHSWSVVGVDRAGNRSPSATRIFFVRSVRLVRYSRRGVLARGLRLRVYCESRCSIRARVQLGGRGPAASGTRRTRHRGITTLTVGLSPALRHLLQATRGRRLNISVTVRSGHHARLVKLLVRW